VFSLVEKKIFSTNRNRPLAQEEKRKVILFLGGDFFQKTRLLSDWLVFADMSKKMDQ
jgi:hypothetical protein